MKGFFIILFSISFIASANSQFGITFKYEKNNYSEWNKPSQFYELRNDRLFQKDLGLGINYWFRLKKYRVEFLPEVSSTVFSNENSAEGNINPLFQMKLLRIGFQLHTQIYPMDLEGDCNCPTWGKDNDFIKKGLYFSLSPVFDYLIHDFNINDIDPVPELDNSLAFKIGIGLGIDIGISKLITVSPYVLVNYYPQISSTAFTQLESTLCPTCDIIERKSTSNTQLSPGIRLIFRPDYKY